MLKYAQVEKRTAHYQIGWLPKNLNVKNTHLSDFWVWKATKNYFNNKSESFVNENKIILVTYLIESSYDLMLSSVDNVSESPGFEKHTKQNGRGKVD